MRKLMLVVVLLGLCGCSGLREMEVATKIKDGQYGIAKGSGNAVYRSKTAFSFLWKQVEFEKVKDDKSL